MHTRISGLIEAAEQGDRTAGDALFATLYAELHSLARRELARHSSQGSLGVTTLLHEAYLDLAARNGDDFPDRARFMGYAAKVMRGLIIDHVRKRFAQKRGGRFELTAMTTDVVDETLDDRDLSRISDALDALAKVDPPLAEVVDQSLMLMATIHREMGNRQKSAAVLRDVEPRLRKVFPDDHVVIAALLTEQALTRQAEGQLASASALIDTALAVAEGFAASGGPAETVQVVLMRRSAILLDLARPGEAATDAQRAVRLFTDEAGPAVSTIYVGRSYLALGLARCRGAARRSAHRAAGGGATPGERCRTRPPADTKRAPVAERRALSSDVWSLEFGVE